MADSDNGQTRVGRKRHVPPLRRRHVNLTDEHCRLLRMWGKGDLSAGVRWLIDAATPLIVKVTPPQPPLP